MRAWAILAAALALPAHAGWQWEPPLEVNTVRGAAVFPHLESANRQGIAVSGGAVAVVWEDNRSGAPRCYAAIRAAGAAAFAAEVPLGDGECYEPVVVALGGGRFLAAWEQAARIHARVLPDGAAARLSDAASAQATLAVAGGRAYAAWAQQAGRHKRIVVAALTLDSGIPAATAVRPVEAAEPVDAQAWPALAASGDSALTVVWEDRRHKHTVPYASHAAAGLEFKPPVRVSDQKSGRVDGLGAGLGAMRPTLARQGGGTVAVWLDKRDFLSGYDVYAAFADAAGRFGKNLPVQDDFGDNMAQWHASVAAGGGRLVAVWDDARDGTADVWLSTWDGAAFGDDTAVPAAAGPGAQSDPVATLDAAGTLHLAWLERGADGTRLRYARAAWK